MHLVIKWYKLRGDYLGKVIYLDKIKTKIKETEMERQLREGFEDPEYQKLMLELAKEY